MDYNEVWDPIELVENCKRVEYKWVFKTKHNSNGNVERYKARIVVESFT